MKIQNMELICPKRLLLEVSKLLSMRVQRMMLQILIIRKVLELKGEELVTHFGDEFIHSSGEESPI